MTITLLKDVLIAAGKLDRYFDGAVPVDLWRAKNVRRPAGLFDMVEHAIVLSNGRPRPADITIEARGNTQWVCVAERPRGVSTFDKPGVPPGKDWDYVKIPQGTVLPEGLAIVQDEYNPRYDATHYTLAPAYDMPLARFRLLLATLAADLIKKAV